MRRRGSAIIIAVFLISAIGSVSFALGRLIYLQVASAGAYEKGVVAYYAAESGLEEGFLRYRYNQEALVPFDKNWTRNSNVFRTDLTALSVNIGNVANKTGIPDTDLVARPLNPNYDLRMGSLVLQYGNINNAADSSSPYYIKRDESKKLKVDFSRANDLNLKFKPVTGTATGSGTLSSVLSDPQCVLLEVKIVGKVGSSASPLEEHKKMLYSPTASCDYSLVLNTADSSVLKYSDMSGYYSQNGLKSNVWFGVGCDLAQDETELYIKPIGADIVFQLSPSAEGSKMVGPTSTISAKGYYKGTSRRLTANIDRQSGSLYDLFDYVIYNGDSS
jgi:hypothetical protein